MVFFTVILLLLVWLCYFVLKYLLKCLFEADDHNDDDNDDGIEQGFPRDSEKRHEQEQQQPKFREKHEQEDEAEADTGSTSKCCICLDEFKDGDRCKILSNCNHVYHKECIDKWLLQCICCPLCRGFAYGHNEMDMYKLSTIL
ncbi:hypothetical protein ACOSP7_024836 [Xanthoceras sorbifolium]